MEDIDERAVKVEENQVNYYDSLKPFSYEDNITGRRKKKFVRVSSEVFFDLINELQNNPNCSYQTYMNDVIKSGYVPKYLSVVNKKIDEELFHRLDLYGLGRHADVCASRILNFFECPTAYESVLEVSGEKYNCSVDFNNPNEELYIMQLLRCNKEYCHYIDEFVDSIKDRLYAFAEDNNLNSDSEEFESSIKKFQEDFVYSWLIRRIVLCDRDFGFHNAGMIHNLEDGTIRMSPNFDFEVCFGRQIRRGYNNLNDIDYVVTAFPEVFEKFMQKLQELTSVKYGKSKMQSILENVIGDDNKISENFLVLYNAYLVDVYKQASKHITSVNEYK